MKNNLMITVFVSILLFAAVAVLFAHEHKPPHNGTLVVFGEEFSHVELVLDPASGKLTGFVLDGEAENPVRLTQRAIRLKLKINDKQVSIALKAAANPLTGETAGDTSEFSAVIAGLKGLSRFSGTIVYAKIKGVTFRNVDFMYPEGNENMKPAAAGKAEAK